jgi:glycosyltransferase involved in cell wall biosynthesis
MENKPQNCQVWGERNDVYKFYTIADLFLFTSNLENKPLCISEALNHNLPILMKWLPNYSDIFNHDNISFLSTLKSDNVKKIKDILGLNEFIKVENKFEKVKNILPTRTVTRLRPLTKKENQNFGP